MHVSLSGLRVRGVPNACRPRKRAATPMMAGLEGYVRVRR
jgi:hypothetical protein